jgi:hypothetical protein
MAEAFAPFHGEVVWPDVIFFLDAEFARFCFIAMGSASELEYHLLLARDLKLIKPSPRTTRNWPCTSPNGNACSRVSCKKLKADR